jgi:hypothetical protein
LFNNNCWKRSWSARQPPGIILEDNTGTIFLVKNQQAGSRTKDIDVVRYNYYIREMREQGEANALFVQSENNLSDILTENVPEKLVMIHGRRIRDGKVQRREDWYGLVEAIKETDESIPFTMSSGRMSNYG